MKYGVFTGIKQIKYLKAAECDYAEVNLSAIEALSDNDFTDLVDENEKSDIKIEVTNGFFPAHIRIVWPEFNVAKIQEYTNRALARAERLGIKVCVLGSGKNRSYREDYTYESAMNDFKKTLLIVGDIAMRHNITIAIEPLSYDETNIINTVKEAYEFERKLCHSNIKLMVDYYHMRNNKEDLKTILEVKDDIIHVHLAGYNSKRRPPYKKTEDNYEEFFNILRQTEYNGRISIEAIIKDLEVEAAHSIQLLRSM